MASGDAPFPPRVRLRTLFATERARRLTILLVALAALLGGNRSANLTRDPVFYAAVARQMAEGGDLAVPRFGDEVYLRKPPLMLWLAAGSFRVLGVTGFAARLPSALFGILSLLLLARLAGRLADRETAFLSVLVLATTYTFLRSARTLRLESVVTASTLGALLVYLHGAERERFPRWGGLAFFGIATLGIMGKGYAGLLPIGLVLLGVPRRRALLSPWFWAGLAVPGLVVGGWLYLVFRELGPRWTLALGADLDQYRTGGSTALLFLGGVLPDYLMNNLPWSILTAAGMVLAVRDLLSPRRADGRARGRARLLLVWFLVVGAASIPKAHQYTRYLVPVTPAFAILAALPLRRLIGRRDLSPLVGFTAGLVLLFSLAYFLFPLPLSRAAHPFRGMAPLVLSEVPPGDPVLVYGSSSPGRRAKVYFHLGRRPRVLDRVSLLSLRGSGRIVLLDRRGRKRLPPGLDLETLLVEDEFSLVRIR